MYVCDVCGLCVCVYTYMHCVVCDKRMHVCMVCMRYVWHAGKCTRMSMSYVHGGCCVSSIAS